MRQRLGQHFLRDGKVLKTILSAAELSPDDTVVEIGPGEGVMTRLLAPRVKEVIAIELDTTLARRLTTEALPGVRVLQADFLKQDLDALAPSLNCPLKFLGNLPYAITSPIFEKILAWPHWETGVFLVQKEVAERMRSAEGSRVYGILSLAVQLFASVEILATVPPGAFDPPPEVFSSVIRVRRKSQPALALQDHPHFFDLVHGAFAHRRKTVANSLAFHVLIEKKKVETWLKEQNISPTLRAENLSLSEYIRLTTPWGIFRRENAI